jgi:hypothetical protein
MTSIRYRDADASEFLATAPETNTRMSVVVQDAAITSQIGPVASQWGS